MKCHWVKLQIENDAEWFMAGISCWGMNAFYDLASSGWSNIVIIIIKLCIASFGQYYITS